MSIAEKITRAKADLDEVFEAGKAEGIAEGIEQGKQAEYDAFWDEYQNKGAAARYDYAFAGSHWNEKTFRPKYNLIVTNAQYMFAFGSLNGLDLTAHLEKLGVTLDTSKSTNFQTMFFYGAPKRVPVLNTVGANSINAIVNYATVETFDKIILRSDGSQTFNAPFYGASSLINLKLEGVIGQNGFSTSASPKLSRASIESIINALSTTTTGLTVTLSKTAVANAFATAEGLEDGSTSAEWLALVATRSNWTIALA